MSLSKISHEHEPALPRISAGLRRIFSLDSANIRRGQAKGHYSLALDLMFLGMLPVSISSANALPSVAHALQPVPDNNKISSVSTSPTPDNHKSGLIAENQSSDPIINQIIEQIQKDKPGIPVTPGGPLSGTDPSNLTDTLVNNDNYYKLRSYIIDENGQTLRVIAVIYKSSNGDELDGFITTPFEFSQTNKTYTFYDEQAVMNLKLTLNPYGHIITSSLEPTYPRHGGM